MKNKTSEIKKVVLGGGCFWCLEASFRLVPGVKKVISGYAGGKTKNPAYDEVCTGNSGHIEVVKIEYNEKIINLEKLLEIFFMLHDPTSRDCQGNDTGSQYRSVIFYENEQQKEAIEIYIEKINKDQKYVKPIVTEIRKLEKFYPAEDYHQEYFKKNPEQAYCQMVVAPKVEKVKKTIGLK